MPKNLIDGIKTIHEAEKDLIGVPFPDKITAELTWERTHYQRGALLAEVERLQKKLDAIASEQRERQWME